MCSLGYAEKCRNIARRENDHTLFNSREAINEYCSCEVYISYSLSRAYIISTSYNPFK